jgi:hypothetical protein
MPNNDVGQELIMKTVIGIVAVSFLIPIFVLAQQPATFQDPLLDHFAKGQPAYEAIVFIGWDQPTGQYSCLWLDNTGGGGLVGQAIAHAKRESDKIAFLFKSADGSLFHTTFVYDKKADSWQWLMDGEEKGKFTAFARVKLTRKPK